MLPVKAGESMIDKKHLTPDLEFSINVENVSFHLLVSASSVPEKTRQPVNLHSHVSAELFACLSGILEIATQTGNIRLFAGDFAVVPSGLEHCMLPAWEKTEYAGFSFICNRRGDRSACDLYTQLSPVVCADRVSVYRGKEALCAEAAEIAKQGRSNSGILPALRAVEFLIHAASEEPEQETGGITNWKKTDDKYDIQRMMWLDNIISSSYMKDITMAEVADSLYISSRQLDRIVRKRYGKTLHRVIMETRVQMAARMLKNMDMTVERIGIAVGFSSGAGFYREFSRYYGMTPAEYRKNEINESR